MQEFGEVLAHKQHEAEEQYKYRLLDFDSEIKALKEHKLKCVDKLFANSL